MLRLAWQFTSRVIFFLTPTSFFEARSLLVRVFGGKVGKHVHIYRTALIQHPWELEVGDWTCIGPRCLIYNLGKIRLGSRTTVSHEAQLCSGTHDYLSASLELVKQDITVGDDVWICTRAFIGPGVEIGSGCVIGACAVVMSDQADWNVVAGNPAEVIGHRKIV